MTKYKKCYSLDEKIISGISASAAKRGIPESEVVQNILHKGLSIDFELTMAERFHFQRESLNKSLDNLLTLFGLDAEGSLSDKYQILCTLCMQMSRQKSRKSRYAVMEQSLFGVLNDIKEMDIDLFGEWTTELSKHGRMRNRYFNLYPKCDEKGMKVKNEDIHTNNNTTTIPVTQSPVTESTQHDLDKLSDEDYLKLKRHERYLKEKESKKHPEKQP